MQERQSQIELLRIIVMILIIITHLVVWGGFKTDNISQSQIISSTLLNDVIRWHVNVFIIITGFFGIKSGWSSIKIIIISIFYTWILYFMECFLIGSVFSLIPIIKSLFFVTHSKYWFVQSYLLLILIAPLLNELIRKETYLYLLFSFLFIDSWCGYIHNETISNGFGIIHFITMYVIGQGIKLYNIKINTKILFFIFIITSLLTVLQALFLKGITSGTGYNNPLLILNGVIVFLLFKNITLNHNKIINDIASSSFAVYLIHDSNLGHFYLKEIMTYINKIGNVQYYYIFYIIFAGAVIYIASYLIDKVLHTIYNPIIIKVKYIINFSSKKQCLK